MSSMNNSLIPAGASAKLRSFWQRPEGKIGAGVLVVTTGLSLWGLYLALPFLIAMVSNTIELVGLCLALFGILYTVTNATFRTVVKNLFQSTMRLFAEWTVGI